MSEFFKTQMGHRFYEATMPALVRQLERLNKNLENKTETKGPVYRILDISSAHVSEASATLLTDLGVVANSMRIPLKNGDAWYMSPHVRGKWGWFINVPYADIDEEAVPKDDLPLLQSIFAVLRHAKALDCQWVLIDGDGEKIPALPSYDW